MLPDDKRMCHHTGFERSCCDLVGSKKCQRWAHIQGTHPQTGQPLDHYGCIDDQQSMLLMSIGKLTMEAGAETAQLRKTIEKARSARMEPPAPPHQITHEAAE